MAEHNHVLRGDTVGCPACDRAEGRAKTYPDPFDEYETWTAPPAIKALPDAVHRLVGEVAICDGDSESKCHWWPECDHETFLCGHEYVDHGECWIIQWLNGFDLYDLDMDEGEHRDPETLEYPDGVIETQWEGDYMLWRLVPQSTDLERPLQEEER